MGVSTKDLSDLIKVTWDSMPPELKAQVAVMAEQIKQEHQEHQFVLLAIVKAFDIVINLCSCGDGSPKLSIAELKIMTKAAINWVTKYHAIDIINRIETLMHRREH